MLIGITGLKRSGKDTIAGFLKEFGYEQVSFAGTLKDMIATLFRNAGWTEQDIFDHIHGDKKEVPLNVLQGKSARYAMQTLGTEWRDLIGLDVETNKVVSKELWTDIVRSKVQSTRKVVISDLRFKHEEAFIREYGGIIIRVTRPGTQVGDLHASEVEMMEIEPDIEIDNTGTLDELEDKVFQALRTISGVYA